MLQLRQSEIIKQLPELIRQVATGFTQLCSKSGNQRSFRDSSSCQSSSGKWQQAPAQAIRDHPGPQAAARAHQASGNKLQLRQSEIIQGLKQLPELIRQVATSSSSGNQRSSRASSSCQSSSGKWQQAPAQAIRDHSGPEAAARAHQASGNRVYTIIFQLRQSEIIQGLQQLPELIRQVGTGFTQLYSSSGNPRSFRVSSSCQSSSGKWEQGLHNYIPAQAIRDHSGPQAAARAHQASGSRVYTIIFQLRQSEIIQGLKQLPELIRQVVTGFTQLCPSSGNLRSSSP